MNEILLKDYEEGVLDSSKAILCEEGILNNSNNKDSVVSFNTCLRCTKRPRCIPRRVIMDTIAKDDSEYYKHRYGNFHVTSSIYCIRQQVLKKKITEIKNTSGMWHQALGSVGHETVEGMRIGNSISEKSLENCEFESDYGDVISISGRFDTFIREVVPYFLDEGEFFYNELEGILFSNGKIEGVLEEIKTKAGLKSIAKEGVDHHHLLQAKIYCSIIDKYMDSSMPNAIYITYINKYNGKSISFLHPVVKKGDILADAIKRKCNDRLSNRVIEIDTDKIIDAMKNRVSIIHESLKRDVIPEKSQSYGWECGYCGYEDICNSMKCRITDDNMDEFIETSINVLDWDDKLFD